jgi:hypothetical protein
LSNGTSLVITHPAPVSTFSREVHPSKNASKEIVTPDKFNFDKFIFFKEEQFAKTNRA